MKQRINSWLFVVVTVLLLSQSAAAYDFMVNGLCYDINSDNTSVSVTFQRTSYPRYTNLSGSLVIPESVTYNGKTFSVTSIGSAFSYCKDLTSVTIPNSVTSIGIAAFLNCSSLASVVMPNSVTTIENQAFERCSALTSVTIPNSVTSINFRAFAECSSLISVAIPNSVIAIKSCAFENCSALSSVTIPNSVTSIEQCAFNCCRGLTSITIPSSVTYLDDFAFGNCTNLTSVTWNARACKDFYYYQSPFRELNVSNFKFGDEVERIPAYLCCRLVGLTSVTISNSVTEIAFCAFFECKGLTSVSIGNSVTSIGEDAFSRCSGLTSVTIPNSVTTIDGGAFSDCSGLNSAIIGNSVTSIGGGAFYNCSGLTSVAIGSSVTSIGYSAFNGCTGLTSVTIPNSVTNIDGYAFHGCAGLTNVILGEKTNAIGEFAFGGCEHIMNVTCKRYHPADMAYGPFAYSVYTNATLHVPKGSLTLYNSSPTWMRFKNIVEDASAIESIKEDACKVMVRDGCIVVEGADKTPIEVIDMAGRIVFNGFANSLHALPQGIYFIRINGQSYKVKL